MNKKIIVFSLILSLSVFSLVADDAAMSAFLNGCNAYSRGDWTSAIFSLKKAASYDSNNNPETIYMLINAEIYSGDYESALNDCDYFLETFDRTLYDSNVMYLKGRCLYSLGEYDKAVIVLSDFCHQYENHDMYASALFWIGECFYACYQYDDAVSLYQRVVTEYTDDSKCSAAQYRIETINQRDREEKLLYLLKQTGEEYLFAKEEYEKQLKIYTPESTSSSRQKLYEAQKRNQELEEKYDALAQELEILKANNDAAERAAADRELIEKAIKEERPAPANNRNDVLKIVETENQRILRELKQKAAQTKLLLDYINDDKELGGK